MDKLTLSILKTLIYYDGLDWPLTALEIWKYLAKIQDTRYKIQDDHSVQLGDIVKALESDELKKHISEKQGFYFLRDRKKDNLAEKRVEAEKLADMKWKILRRRAKFISLIPYIRLVMVSGSIAIGDISPESDFDILIIVKAGRIWTARFILTVFMDILGWRRRGDKTKNKLCLNHYLADDSLELQSRNVSTAYGYYGRLIPIMGDLALWRKFQEANNWLGEYFEHYEARSGKWEVGTIDQRFINPPKFFSFIAYIGEFILDFRLFLPFQFLTSHFPFSASNLLENFLRRIQLKKIKENPLTAASEGRLIYTDKELEFHPGSQERELLEKYKLRLKSLQIR